jgi:hypothetical protein
LLLAVVPLVLGAGAARAQEAGELAGVWRRVKASGGGGDLYRLQAQDGGLTGELIGAEEGSSCTLQLTLTGGKLEGTATWKDAETGAELAVRWELQVQGPRQLRGRCEWKEWEFYADGARVAASGWEDYSFERQARVGLVTEGSADEPPFGNEIEDLAALEGGWEGPGGPWALTRVEGGWIDLLPVGHELASRIRLKDERGTLRGGATLPGNEGCKVELAFDEGKLTGRASWREGSGDAAVEGWSPLVLSRLPRTDAGATAAPEAPAPGEEGPLVGVWKRDDGLFLRLREGPGGLEGDLVDREGKLQARVSLQGQGGLWTGRANWDGAEAGWELARQGDELTGRCEWIDTWQGRVAARGWVGRTFKRLRRVM